MSCRSATLLIGLRCSIVFSSGRKQRKSPSTANSLRKARRGSECSATAGELSVDSGEDAKHIWNEYFEFEVDHVEVSFSEEFG